MQTLLVTFSSTPNLIVFAHKNAPKPSNLASSTSDIMSTNARRNRGRIRVFNHRICFESEFNLTSVRSYTDLSGFRRYSISANRLFTANRCEQPATSVNLAGIVQNTELRLVTLYDRLFCTFVGGKDRPKWVHSERRPVLFFGPSPA